MIDRFCQWLGETAAVVVHWARVVWCYGECVQCNRRVCPKVGPWYSRRRERCYCNRCEWQS